MTAPNALDAPKLAQMFHEAYERLAPQFGYETRKASAKPWAEVPENNRKLMTAVCAEILQHIATIAEIAAPSQSRVPNEHCAICMGTGRAVDDVTRQTVPCQCLRAAPSRQSALQTQECEDCKRAAAHAHSDATTPGFFYDKCEKHRVTKLELLQARLEEAEWWQNNGICGLTHTPEFDFTWRSRLADLRAQIETAKEQPK